MMFFSLIFINIRNVVFSFFSFFYALWARWKMSVDFDFVTATCLLRWCMSSCGPGPLTVRSRRQVLSMPNCPLSSSGQRAESQDHLISSVLIPTTLVAYKNTVWPPGSPVGGSLRFQSQHNGVIIYYLPRVLMPRGSMPLQILGSYSAHCHLPSPQSNWTRCFRNNVNPH